MKIWLAKLLEETTPQGRSAFRLAAIGLLAVFLSLPLYFYVAAQTGAWQMYAVIAGLVVVGITAGLSAMFARQNRIGLAVGVLLGSACLVIPYIAALVSGLGLVLSLTLFLMAASMIGQTLSGRPATVWLIGAAVFAVITLLIDLFATWARLSFPLLQSVLPFIAGAVVIAMSFFAIRQFGNYSLRTKLLVSITALVALSIGILAGTNYYNNRANLNSAAGDGLKSVAITQAKTISDTLLREASILKSFNLSKIVQDKIDEVNASYGPDEAQNLQQIQALDEQWRAADAANDDNAAVVRPLLNSEVASELREFRTTFPENSEVFMTDRYGALVAATNRTSDYYQADEEWWQAAYNDGKGALYFGQPEFDESSKTFGIIMAVPIFSHGTDEFAGVARTTLNIESIVAILNTELLGGSGEADLYLPGNQVLDPEFPQELIPADPEVLAHLNALTGETAYASFSYEGKPGIVSATAVTTTNQAEQAALQNLGWVLVVHQDDEALIAPIRVQARSTLIIALVILGLGALASILLSQTLTGPILRLTQVAQQIATGNVNVQAKVESTDEIGTLAGTFNSMTSQLHELIGSLEQRVSDRTKALGTVAEISTAASTILEPDKLLQQVVELTKGRFDLYHAHIYLLNDAGDTLVLAAGAGEPGRQMVAQKRSIPLDREQSLVARAARERKGVTVNDVTLTPDFLPNPLLPDTHAELAVPMIVGENLIGVFDVQSEIIGRFTDADIAVQTTLASQVASAVQNARLYTRAETIAQEAQSLVDNAPEAIVVVDLATGLFANPNENAVRLYGLAREELVKVGPAQMSPPRQPDGRDSTEKAMEKIGEAMQGGMPIFEWMHRNGQGEDFLCEIRLVHLPGEHPRVRASVTDITERKRNEDLTRQRAHQQEALNLITQRIQSTTSIEAALQVTARELGHALGMKQTIVSLDSTAENKGN